MQFCNGWSLRRKLIWGHSLGNMLWVRRARWYGEIIKISLPLKAPFTCAPPQKGRMRICYSSWCQNCTGLLLWMGAIKKQDIKTMTIPFPYCKNISGGQEWPSRLEQVIKSCKCCLQYWGWHPQGPFMPYSGYHSLRSLTCWLHQYWDHVGAESIT